MLYYPTNGAIDKKVVFLSDTHLFSHKCKVKPLHKFLKDLQHRVEAGEVTRIVLVGDILDLWCIRESVSMRGSKRSLHIDCVRLLLNISRKGCRIDYILGNHDDGLGRLFTGESLKLSENLVIHRNSHAFVFEGALRVLCMHGHEFDLVSRYAWLGDIGYTLLHRIQDMANHVREWFGLRPWSLSKYIKTKVKGVEGLLNRWSNNVERSASAENCNVAITGHIHAPMNGPVVYNCGCWVENSNLTWVELNLSSFRFELKYWSTLEQDNTTDTSDSGV